MTTAQKLQEIIEKGGFASKVATTVLNSENFKCSWKQFEVIKDAHDSEFLFWEEMNVVTEKSMVTNNASFQDWNQEQIDRAKRTHLY